MRFRGLTLVVMVYLALDLANPMMPGAVQLVGTSLETIDGYQPRSDEASARALPSVPRHVGLVPPQRTPSLQATPPIAPRVPILAGLVRASFESSGNASSSSDDD